MRAEDARIVYETLVAAQGPWGTSKNMSKVLFNGEIKNGLWYWGPGQLQYFHTACRRLAKGHFIIELKKFSQKRNSDINAAYYARNGTISKVTGYWPEELHVLFMRNGGFGNYREVPNEHGKIASMFFRDSSTELSQTEFHQLIKLQDDFATWWNQDNEPEYHIILERPKVA